MRYQLLNRERLEQFRQIAFADQFLEIDQRSQLRRGLQWVHHLDPVSHGVAVGPRRANRRCAATSRSVQRAATEESEGAVGRTAICDPEDPL